MGNVNCCKKPDNEYILDLNDADIIKDKDEYPHDSDPSMRYKKPEEEVEDTNLNENDKIYKKQYDNTNENNVEIQKEDDKVFAIENNNNNQVEEKMEEKEDDVGEGNEQNGIPLISSQPGVEISFGLVQNGEQDYNHNIKIEEYKPEIMDSYALQGMNNSNYVNESYKNYLGQNYSSNIYSSQGTNTAELFNSKVSNSYYNSSSYT